MSKLLVTAGACGIGREIVRAFASNEASVFICDIDEKALNVLAGEIPKLKIGI
jgi:NAD(P)-dependent dehydrogenase (short-subunit alcohol dehydrogenase family)